MTPVMDPDGVADEEVNVKSGQSTWWTGLVNWAGGLD